MTQPLVSCIMPTANRQKFIPFAVEYFLAQDYDNAELIIIDDGIEPISNLLPENPKIKYYFIQPIGKLGIKRNYACTKANGEIIMHWDDDDWYAKDWISQQVNYLLLSEADICGVENVHFYSAITETLWVGTALNRNNSSGKTQWLNGATFIYWKSFWEDHPFKNLQTGEDDDFLSHPDAKIFAHEYIDGYISLLHPDNTSVKYFENPMHKRQAINS